MYNVIYSMCIYTHYIYLSLSLSIYIYIYIYIHMSSIISSSIISVGLAALRRARRLADRAAQYQIMV